LRSRSAPDEDGAAVGGAAVAGTRPRSRPVDDAGHGGGVQPGAAAKALRAERAAPVNEIKAVQVDVLEINARADVVVEQGQLDVSARGSDSLIAVLSRRPAPRRIHCPQDDY